jgi:hypothetical protein
MFCSESSRVIVVVKGLKAPPLESVEPAASLGLKPPMLSQPSVISIGVSPSAGGPPDQGVNS